VAQRTQTELEHDNRDLRVRVWQLIEEGQGLRTQLQERDQRIKQLEGMVYIDPLTKIGNRWRFEEELEKLQHSSERFCLAMIDLDDLKQINDRHGHEGGDEVLEKLGIILMEECGGNELVTRIGGDEFCIFLRGCTREEAHTYLDNLRIRIAEQLTITTDEEQEVHFSVSVGAAEHQAGESSKSLRRRASAALKRAKDDGKNRVVRAA
jgi:diguanylate cyclase (GGDEF)-like protein